MYFKSNLKILYFHMTVFYLAVKNENLEIINILLSNEKLDPNIIYILI